MDDDKTIIMSPLSNKDSSRCIEITIIGSNSKPLDSVLFTESFTIGRAQDNDITVPDAEISRHHVKIINNSVDWEIRDLNSSNGSYINDERIDSSLLAIPCILKLGESDTLIKIKYYKDESQLESQTTLSFDDDLTQIVSDKSKTLDFIDVDESPSKEEIFRRYIGDDKNNVAGEYTQVVRDVIKEDNQKKVKKYNYLIFGVGALLIGALSLVIFQHLKISKSKELVTNIFYDMKNLEIDLANTEIELKKNRNSTLVLEVDKKRESLKEMRKHYADYIKDLGNLNTNKISKSNIDQLILKVAKSFGELEIDLPAEFAKETKKYIRYWQNSPRMKKAMKRLYENDYNVTVLKALKKESLPPQFLYLAMQESNFDIKAVGPRTRWGIAKGAWQFIPSTAREYGLKVGPLVDSPVYDSEDERHDFTKATTAAAKYLKYIYSTEAQASGLLVMAGYNWGDNRVKKLINTMPNNPRERNFWKLIQTHKIPEETYNYVFYIFSAAVIAEDPAFFGFKFKSPTANLN